MTKQHQMSYKLVEINSICVDKYVHKKYSCADGKTGKKTATKEI